MAISALSDYQPFSIKLAHWIQVLVKSIEGFDHDAAKRVFVLADEFKKTDEFKIGQALHRNVDNANSVFYFISLYKPSDYLKELSDKGLCHYIDLKHDVVGLFVSTAVQQAHLSNQVVVASDMDALKAELDQMENQNESWEAGDE